MSIECFNLGKTFGSKIALHNISLKIAEGKVTGLVGPNGAGKSTLIKLITGLIWPSEGSVMIDGFDVHHEHARALRHLGAIVEWPSFYPDLSARRNLDILSGGHGAAYGKKLLDITRFLDIDKVLNRKAGVLSTGMKQRLGIALALLPDSHCIILDEPANGLDPTGIVEIRNLIREYNRKSGVTVLVSSHLLSEIEMICDDIILLSDGALKASGSLNDLLNRKRYIRVASEKNEMLLQYLRSAREKQCSWILSEPVMAENTILFQTSPDVQPEEVSRNIFEAGFSISHFAVEHQNLEDFFLQNTGVEK